MAKATIRVKLTDYQATIIREWTEAKTREYQRKLDDFMSGREYADLPNQTARDSADFYQYALETYQGVREAIEQGE